MLAQDSHPWTGIQWLGDHVIPKVKMLLCTWVSTGRTHKIQAWVSPPQNHWAQHGLQEGRSSHGRHTSLLFLYFEPCKLLFLLPVDMVLLSVTFACHCWRFGGVWDKSEWISPVLRWQDKNTFHKKQISVCSTANANCFSSEGRGESEKQDTPQDKEIPSTSAGR